MNRNGEWTDVEPIGSGSGKGKFEKYKTLFVVLVRCTHRPTTKPSHQTDRIAVSPKVFEALGRTERVQFKKNGVLLGIVPVSEGGWKLNHSKRENFPYISGKAIVKMFGLIDGAYDCYVEKIDDVNMVIFNTAQKPSKV